MAEEIRQEDREVIPVLLFLIQMQFIELRFEGLCTVKGTYSL